MSRLSIEQFELIRRLRNSGIDKEDLISAFDQFSEVDKTFGDVYSTPVSKSQSTLHNSSGPSRVVLHKVRHNPYPHHQPNNTMNNHSSKNNHFSNMEEENHHVNNSTIKPHPAKSSSNVPSEVILPHFSRNGLTISAVSTPASALNASCSDDSSSNWSTASITKVKKSDDGKSDTDMLCEIRHFIVRNNVKLSMIAEMTGIVPTAVRNYIHGNLMSVSDETKHSICMWYQMTKNNPSTLREFYPMKRERFVFRPAHLRVLEESYKNDAYPDSAKREYIVEECNRVYEQEVGHEIADLREKVTSVVVSNWFNNRRKEAKRQVKRVSQNTSGMSENGQMVGLQYEGLHSPPQMETQDVKPNISDMLQTSSINTPPSYSSNEDNETFMTQESDGFIPVSIKQEPPDN